MLTVHHLNNSRSQRVLWLLEELGLDHDIAHYQRDRKTMLAPAELMLVHPLGKSPVLTDGDITVAETGAIVEYLLARAPALHQLLPPAGSEAGRRCTYWLHFAEGSAMPPLLMRLIFDRVRSSPMPFFVRPIARRIADRVDAGFIAPNLRRHLDFMESELGRSAWFAGDAFSAADIMMSFPVEVSVARGGLDAGKPKLNDWLERIHARPAYQRALQRGGPYSIVR